MEIPDLINKDGKRMDGRELDELREVKMKVGVLMNAAGSAYIEWGKNKVLAGVYGPRELQPRHFQNPEQARASVIYNMASFSVNDRKRPGPDRRSTEISKVISESFESAIFTSYFPRATIDINIEILEAEAGTRCAGLTCASLALADAGIPMRDMVVSCAAGKIQDQIVLDLRKEEDNFGQADLPIGILPRTGEIVLLQMDGHLTQKEFEQAQELAIKGCQQLYELQKKTLKEKYEKMYAPKEEVQDEQ